MKLDTDQEDKVLTTLAELAYADLQKRNGEIDELILYSPARAGGMLDVTPATLASMKLPKVDLLGNGKTIRYRLSTLKKALEERGTK